MQTIRGAALLVAGALMVSGLAACGGEGEPEESSSTASPSAVEPSSSESSESSGSGSSSPSPGSSGAQGDGEVIELPTAAKKHTKEGAITFNEFYWEQVGESYVTGNPYVLEAYTNDCAVCDNIAGKVRQDREDGVSTRKNPYSVRKSSARPRSDSGFRVELTVQINRYDRYRKSGERVGTIAAQSLTVVSDTRWSDGQWEIRDQVRTE